MMTYFQATLLLSTESMYWNEESQAYEGYSGEIEFQGTISEAIGETPEEAIIKLMERQGYDLPKDAVLEDSRIIFQNEGEHHYSTEPEERIPFQEIWEIVVSKVESVASEIVP